MIAQKVAMTNLMIVLVGKLTHSATGVLKELQFAVSNRVPIFGVYVGSAGEKTSLPAGLPRNRVIAWDWEAIAAAIRQMMKEGKNRQTK